MGADGGCWFAGRRHRQVVFRLSSFVAAGDTHSVKIEDKSKEHEDRRAVSIRQANHALGEVMELASCQSSPRRATMGSVVQCSDGNQ